MILPGEKVVLLRVHLFLLQGEVLDLIQISGCKNQDPDPQPSHSTKGVAFYKNSLASKNYTAQYW
jgi:hypothetical protein